MMDLVDLLTRDRSANPPTPTPRIREMSTVEKIQALGYRLNRESNWSVEHARALAEIANEVAAADRRRERAIFALAKLEDIADLDALPFPDFASVRAILEEKVT